MNQWHKPVLQTRDLHQLQDLATILSKVPHLKFDLAYGSFINIEKNELTSYSHWGQYPFKKQMAGHRSDIYLRALGTIHHTDLAILNHFGNFVKKLHVKNFALQLFTIIEDLRLETIITKLRPGTEKDFSIRHQYLRHYFTNQSNINGNQRNNLDELFCLIYLLLHKEKPTLDLSNAQLKQQETIKNLEFLLYEAFSAQTTKDVFDLVVQVIHRLPSYYADMKKSYFSFPIDQTQVQKKEKSLFKQLLRTDDALTYREEDFTKNENDYKDETFSTWHRETDDTKNQQTFLHMDLDEGTRTDLLGGEAREIKASDKAFTTVQGSSQETEENQDAQQTSRKIKTTQQHNKKSCYGIENIHVYPVFHKAKTPTIKEQHQYKTYAEQINPDKRRLITILEKILEHKKYFPRTQLYYGRLSKNLIPLFIEESPRIFYKKDDLGKDFDAVFTLMVDCSASMEHKMKDTKLSITLFHEVLKHLKIPHNIVGFWEEASFRTEEIPNHFHFIHSFTDSFYKNNGPKIMQLKAEDDNRDGFSIRLMTEQMTVRQEKHKFLLVFSDGEPAAKNYEQNGIIDTYQAVNEARKKGVHVLGVYIADGVVEEQKDQIIKQIYGQHRIVVPDVSSFLQQFASIFKKLLLRTTHI